MRSGGMKNVPGWSHIGEMPQRCLNYANPENLRSFKSISKEVSLSLKKIKNDNFKSFISSLNPSRPIIDNFKFIKKLKNRLYNPSSKSTDSNIPLNNKLLLEAFNKIANNYSYSNNFQNTYTNNAYYTNNPNFDKTLLNPISIAEVLQAIKGSKTRSAPGLDGIPYIILKNIPLSLVE